uniref:Uncharacterized protein n=1 Tax=Latimeria chalumnae TaxID=7897 RepID=H3AEF5_LATCH
PLFAFWNLAKRLIELNLLFTRSLREKNYLLYVATLKVTVPYFFFDHPNYVRWLSVHIRDLDALPDRCPSVYTEFMQGKFVISLKGIPFTGIPLDQANEFNIKKVKVCDDESLFTINTRQITDTKVTELIRSLESIGQQQYQNFVEEQFVSRNKSVEDPIKHNGLAMFSTPVQAKQATKSKLCLLYSKSDNKLFSRLYIGCEARGAVLDEFFKHENHAFPPALSDVGELRLGTKSGIVQCLVDIVDETVVIPFGHPFADSKVMKGSVLVHMIKTKTGKTFGQYARDDFSEYIRKQFDDDTQQIDIIFDVYKPDSLKNSTREKRGKTSYKSRIEERTPVPKKWQNFLHDSENKEQLFRLLANKMRFWNTWTLMPEITHTFLELLTPSHELNEKHFNLLERFVIFLYEKTSGKIDINKLRKRMFTQKTANMERLPPTKAALREQIKRAHLQSQCWSNSHLPVITQLNPADYEWKLVEGVWCPHWTDLPQASAACCNSC